MLCDNSFSGDLYFRRDNHTQTNKNIYRMTEKQEIKNLHGLLKYRNHWYIDTRGTCDLDFIGEIAEIAKTYADKKLSKMGWRRLYRKYKGWLKSDRIMPPDEDYYTSFLNDLIWDLGLETTQRDTAERDRYRESVCLKIEFI